MRTSCSICSTELIFALRSCVQMLSSMPQRTCRPIAIAIVLIGSTFSIEVSSVSTAPSGTRANEVGQVVEVRRVEAAADRDPGQDQRHVAGAARASCVRPSRAGRCSRAGSASGCRSRSGGGCVPRPTRGRPGSSSRGRRGTSPAQPSDVPARSASHICSTMFIWLVLIAIVTWSGRGCELGEHVARVVAQPLGRLALAFRRERDRAADLDDQFGHACADAGDQFVELRQALAALAVELAHVQVQHGRAGVVAVDGLLDLRLPS